MSAASSVARSGRGIFSLSLGNSSSNKLDYTRREKWGNGKGGKGEKEKGRRGDTETRGHGDAGTRRRGDTETRRRGDAAGILTITNFPFSLFHFPFSFRWMG